MTARIIFFPVGNGDMTLIETESGKKILIDSRIRKADDYPDVLSMLRERLTRDSAGRLFIDLFVWSHPDEDHCQGMNDCFHLGLPENWSPQKDLIFINEIWSSPLVYRRADKNHKLCDAAKALNAEIKRRVNRYKEERSMSAGNYVLILCEDEGDNTTGIPEIVLKLDQTINCINGKSDSTFEGVLLGPSPKSDLEEEEDNLGKNHSSVIFNYKIFGGNKNARFLSAGDAEVVCLEALNNRMKTNKTETNLEYDILQAPHHCSWHSMSHDSLSDKGDQAKTSDEAISALSHAKNRAFIISSSNTIEDDDNDPPAYRAKQEYQKILEPVGGSFKCVDDHKKNGANVPLVIEISSDGLKLIPASGIAKSSSSGASAVNRRGGDGYA